MLPVSWVQQAKSHHLIGAIDLDQQEEVGLLLYSRGREGHSWNPGDPCEHLMVLSCLIVTMNRHVCQTSV